MGSRTAWASESDGDDLPDLNALLGKPICKKADVIHETSRSQAAAPTALSNSGRRRIRRLGSEDNDVANPLFDPWNPNEGAVSSSSRHNRRRETSQYISTKDHEHAKVNKQRVSKADIKAANSKRQTSSKLENQIHTERTLEVEPYTRKVSLEKLQTLRKERLPNRHTAGGPRKRSAELPVRDTPKKTTVAMPRRAKQQQSELGSKLEYSASDPETDSGSSIYHSANETSSDYNESDHEIVGSEPDSDAELGKLLGRISTKIAEKPNESRLNANVSKDTGKRILRKDINLPPAKPKQPSSRTEISTKQKEQIKTVAKKTKSKQAIDLAEQISKLKLDFENSDENSDEESPTEFLQRPSTPPRNITPTGLVSPRKAGRIPQTPHRPTTDTFWNQEFVDDWNDQYSPRKETKAIGATARLTKAEPKKETKKSFAARKHEVAESFLCELDTQITQGKIAELAAATGGVKIVWSKTLNTTAGRANWRRETVRTKKGEQVDVQHKHHAFIELAEKVIDDEDRLLNVLAHEFCHLANFMVNGMTTNPHGKEFKVWAAKCSKVFGDRGIQVTTKHSYEISFKYIWTCASCSAEYKRHSKSIDPARHRCGTCKGVLNQTKPVPRGAAVGAKPSEYQIFMKEQMKVVRAENPGSPQKEVMRMVASRWAERTRASAEREATPVLKKGGVLGVMVNLSLDDDDNDDDGKQGP